VLARVQLASTFAIGMGCLLVDLILQRKCNRRTHPARRKAISPSRPLPASGYYPSRLGQAWDNCPERPVYVTHITALLRKFDDIAVVTNGAEPYRG
jgi:hypothetical protein